MLEHVQRDLLNKVIVVCQILVIVQVHKYLKMASVFVKIILILWMAHVLHVRVQHITIEHHKHALIAWHIVMYVLILVHAQHAEKTTSIIK